jgi:hypothetical protein
MLFLVATKQAGAYTISDLSNDKSTKRLEAFRCEQVRQASRVLALPEGKNEQVAVILYHVPSIINVVFWTGLPSSCPDCHFFAGARDKPRASWKPSPKSVSTRLDPCWALTTTESLFLHVFDNRTPTLKGGSRWGLAFTDTRTSRASSKNMQMEHKTSKRANDEGSSFRCQVGQACVQR